MKNLAARICCTATRCSPIPRSSTRAEPKAIGNGSIPRLLNIAVVEPDGALVPLTYGFSRRFEICNVKQQRLVAMWPDYARRTCPRFRNLCRRVFDELTDPGAQPYSKGKQLPE